MRITCVGDGCSSGRRDAEDGRIRIDAGGSLTPSAYRLSLSSRFRSLSRFRSFFSFSRSRWLRSSRWSSSTITIRSRRPSPRRVHHQDRPAVPRSHASSAGARRRRRGRRHGDVSGFERSRVHERLERGPRLPARLCRTVVRALVEVTATNERSNGSRLWIDRDQRGLQDVVRRDGGLCGGGASRRSRQRAIDRAEALSGRRFSRALLGHIDGGVDLQTAFRHPLPRNLLHELSSHFLV